MNNIILQLKTLKHKLYSNSKLCIAVMPFDLWCREVYNAMHPIFLFILRSVCVYGSPVTFFFTLITCYLLHFIVKDSVSSARYSRLIT